MDKIEKIRQKIERLKGYISVTHFAEELLSFIDSLQHEQPCEDLEAEIEMQWDSFNKHLAEYNDGSEDVVWLNWNSFVDVARHFYEFGKKSK